ncbi:MAG: Fic family protein [Rhodothermales bacterium]|jgi:Fic family protein
MNPPYQLTDTILSRVAEVMRLVGHIEALHTVAKQSLELRRQNRAKSIYSTLSIEGNSLTIDQVSAVINDKPVLGPQKDILEVANAIATYDRLPMMSGFELVDLLGAHQLMMAKLTPESGKFRSRGVGIQKGGKITHIAPPAANITALMNDLFGYLRDSQDHMLIKSCVCHYEIEFIHPFSDGNGRMGRLWQTRLLMDVAPIFEYLPIESMIKDRQQTYYAVLEACDASGSSTQFIEFMLDVLAESLSQAAADGDLRPMTCEERLAQARDHFGASRFARKDYYRLHQTISTATASRDLKSGVTTGAVTAVGTGRMTRYYFIN